MGKDKTPWEGYITPSRIFGNLYFVGNRAVCQHLIDTGDGLILIDSGFPENLYQLVHNIWLLGFKPEDIKYIIHTHGHYDHLGATRQLVEMCGAKTFLGAPDSDIAEGKVDASLADALGCVYSEFFTPDVKLCDKDVITLGNTYIKCVATPGHSDGTMSFFFDVTDGKKTLRAGLHGGVGTNTMDTEGLKKYNRAPSCREEHLFGLMKVRGEKFDICLGNHIKNNDTEGKIKRVLDGETDAFIDRDEWVRFIDSRIKRIKEVIEK